MPKKITGLTATTAEKLLLDAGAYFKNFVVGTDTFETAVGAGKLIGATAGGGSFSAIPTTRKIEVDGAKGHTIGLDIIDDWVVTVTSNLKEVSVDSLSMSLGAATVTDGPTGYKKITPNPEIKVADYIENITWVGRLSGSLVPVIVVVKNARAREGLTVNTSDKNEAVLPIKFTGHYEHDDENPPFEIYYPDESVE